MTPLEKIGGKRNRYIYIHDSTVMLEVESLVSYEFTSSITSRTTLSSTDCVCKFFLPSSFNTRVSTKIGVYKPHLDEMCMRIKRDRKHSFAELEPRVSELRRGVWDPVGLFKKCTEEKKLWEFEANFYEEVYRFLVSED